MTEHEHVYRKADLRLKDGTPIVGGRRCACGAEVVGDGPIVLSADIVRVGHEFNRGISKSLLAFARAVEETRKRRFPD